MAAVALAVWRWGEGIQAAVGSVVEAMGRRFFE